MPQQLLLEALQNAFRDHGKISGDELNLFCPKHPHTNSGKHRRKMSISLSKPIRYHCWIGGEGGTGLRKLIEEYSLDPAIFEGIDGLDLEPQERKNEVVSLPIDYIPLVSRVISIEHAHALKYIKQDRGLTDDQILRYKIGFCERGDYRGRIIVPSFDYSGEFNYFVARSYLANSSMTYRYPSARRGEIIFNEINMSFSQEIQLCEGVFDSFSCGPNSIPLLGSSISEKLIMRLIDDCPCVYVVLDPDTYTKPDITQDSKLLKMVQKLKECDIPVKLIDVRGEWKDVDEMVRKAGYGEFLKRKENAIPVDFSFIMRAKLNEV